MTDSLSDRAPELALWSTDYTRGMLGLGSFGRSWPTLKQAPRGDGHPVLVIPGLGASDVSTVVLRRYLRYLEYRTYSWGLGTNIGPTARVVAGLPARLETLRDQNSATVSIIGWSLGGIFARQLARAKPDAVRQVITLGSPIRLKDHQHTNARHFYRHLERFHAEELVLPLEDGMGPLPVPATSIYSKRDGIVSWKACLDEPGPQSENIEVSSAHFGFGWHPDTLLTIADRLAQPEGEWAPFSDREQRV